MSNIRYNEKELASFAVIDTVTKQGPLQKFSKKSKQKFLWLILKCNLLFVYKSNTQPAEDDEAHSCYILEDCYPTVTESGFQISFSETHRKSGISFLCSIEESEVWVNLINQSTFRFLRHSLEYYTTILSQESNKEETEGVPGDYTFSLDMVVSLQNVRLQQSECSVCVQVFKVDSFDHMSLFAETAKVIYNSHLITFYNSVTLTSDDFNKDSIISFGVFKLSHSKQVLGSALEYVDVKLSHILANKGHANIIPVNGRVGPSSLLILDARDTGDKSGATHHRSSCLFSEHIQPLLYHDKLLLFNTLYNPVSEAVYRLPCNDAANSVIAREVIMKINNPHEVARAWLTFIIRLDKEELAHHSVFGLYSTQLQDKMLYGSTKLEYRVEVHTQHLTYLSTKGRQLKASMCVPSNLSLYRLEIYDRGTYDVLDKVTLAAPANYSNGFSSGGLLTLYNDVKGVYSECQRHDRLRERIVQYNHRLTVACEAIARAAGNSDLDHLTRHFKDFEVLSQGIISSCTSPGLADIILELAVHHPSLYVWERETVVRIDTGWSIASTVRHLHNQLKVLGDVCEEMYHSFQSELWVEQLFLPCNDLARNLASLSAVAVLALHYTLYSLEGQCTSFSSFTMRCDAVLSQLVTGLVASFHSSLCVYMDDVYFWLQLLNVGFYCQVEVLLSCCKDELGMIEDVYTACELLKHAKLEVVPDDRDCRQPVFTGSRYNMVIRVPVQLKVYALLLDICQGDVERKVNVLPCMFVQGIDKGHSKAAVGGDVTLQSTINTNYCNYIQSKLDKRKVFYNSLQDEVKYSGIKEALSCVRRAQSDPIQFITRCQQLAKLLCAGEMTCCSTGLDRTALSVTHDMVQYMSQHHDVTQSTLVTDSLRQGAWLHYIDTIRGQPYYSFSGDKRSYLPRQYQPPVGSYKQYK